MGIKLIKIKFHVVAIIKKIIYKLLFGKRFKVGNHSTFRKNFSVYLDKGNIEIGNNCFFNNDCSINSLNRIVIEDGTIFGENIKIYDHNHRFNKADTMLKEQGFSIGEVYIGANCWIGSNSVILKGARIGDNCVIGAGCVIDKEIPSYSVVTSSREVKIEKLRIN